MLTLWTWDSEADRGRLAFLQSEIKSQSHTCIKLYTCQGKCVKILL